MAFERIDVETARRHLRKSCPRMAVLVERFPAPRYRRTRNSFQTLCRAIVGQQLSGKAAQTIYDRFRALFAAGVPRPEELLSLSSQSLRGAGLSASKASFLQALARAYQEGEVQPRRFARMSNQELRDHLTRIKGLGPWTVDMFLIFGLTRPDVLPVGDLGVRKGIQRCFELAELPGAATMEALAAPWQPHRSVACHYLWRLAEAEG